MDRQRLAKFAALPRLGAGVAKAKACKICSGPSRFFDVTDFNKFCDYFGDVYKFGASGIIVTWYRCIECKLIWTDFFDSWDNDDFSRFVYNDDYVCVDPQYTGQRSKHLAPILAKLLQENKDSYILDYGAGAGYLARELKARGFNRVFSYDPFSSPRRPKRKFDIITCIEVIEHSIDPKSTLREIKRFLSDDGGIVFSQALQPPEIEELRANWWYVGPRNGHASIFAHETLLALANRTGFRLYAGNGLHGLAMKQSSPTVLEVMARIGPQIGNRLRLVAPSMPRCNGWHDIETAPSRDRFRWTACSEVIWGPQRCRPGLVEIRIPYLNEVTPGFATRCTIIAGEVERRTEVTARELICWIECQSDVTDSVKLLTPPCLAPSALRGANDIRTLGLAVPVG